MNTRPCYKCPDRYPGCHSKCQKPDYLKDQARRHLIIENKSLEKRRNRVSITWDKRGTKKKGDE